MTEGLEALADRPASYTPEFSYVRGSYDIGGESLAYYSVAMRVDEAKNTLILPRDVVLDPMAPIRMAELFQRELDEKRALDEIVPYLKQAKQPKFFNAITVVILPLEPENDRMFAHKYADLSGRPPAPDGGGLSLLDVGPVRLRQLPPANELGRISWDQRLARAVIVDGQHRFFAIKELMDDSTFPHRQDLSETSIPVLLLVLDPRAGFSTSNQEDISVLQTCRALFIDLNKHAVQVSRARQYLLDDRDLSAVSMREITSEEVGGTEEPVKQRVHDTKRVPLALIDWSSEEAKFDSGPYVTTVLTLYDMAQMTLAISEPKPTDYTGQKDYVAKLVARLELEGRDDFDESRIKQEIERTQDAGLPFALNNADIHAAGRGFRDSVGTMITRALTELQPYAELVTGYEARKLLSGKYEQWLGLDRGGKNAYVEETGLDLADEAHAVWSEVKDKYNVAYQVVFQKAFVNALVEMDRYRAPVLAHWGADEHGTRETLIDEWVRRFNTNFAPHLRENDVWEGAGITAAGTIAWTQPSQRAVAGFVIFGLIAPLDEWVELSDADALAAAGTWLEEAWAKAGAGRPAASLDGLFKQGAAWKRAITTYVKTRFRLNEEEREPDESDFIDMGARKLRKLAKDGGRVGAPQGSPRLGRP